MGETDTAFIPLGMTLPEALREVDALRTALKADEMVRTSVRENADAACAENAILCISIADALDALDPGDAEEPQP